MAEALGIVGRPAHQHLGFLEVAEPHAHGAQAQVRLDLFGVAEALHPPHPSSEEAGQTQRTETLQDGGSRVPCLQGDLGATGLDGPPGGLDQVVQLQGHGGEVLHAVPGAHPTEAAGQSQVGEIAGMALRRGPHLVRVPGNRSGSLPCKLAHGVGQGEPG